MLKKMLIVVSVFTLFFLPRISSGEAAASDLFSQVQEFNLENGLKVLLMPEKRAPVITLQVWYRVGSRNEVLGKTGLSHLTEHLMFRGTEKYGPKIFPRLVQKHGGNNNAFTSKDYTAYFENGPKAPLGLWLEMEADRMRNLQVNEELFRTEQQVVVEERRMRTDDDPVNTLVEDTTAAAFKAHSYQWPIIGWMHDIQTLRHGDFLEHYRHYYQPNNAVVVLVGDIDPETALNQIKDTFGKIPRGPEPPPVRSFEPPQKGERRVSLEREAQLPYLLMSYHVPNIGNPDTYALEVLSLILAHGRSSRFYQQLVYEKKMALDVGADYNLATASPSLFTVYGQPLPGKTVVELERTLEEEIAKVKTTLVTDRELAKAKNQTEAEFIMAQDSIFYRGMLLGRYESIANWKRLKEILPGIQAVTKEDVQRVAKQYLLPDNRNVGVLHPLKTDRPLAGRYKRHDQIQ
jgi:zinc protease